MNVFNISLLVNMYNNSCFYKSRQALVKLCQLSVEYSKQVTSELFHHHHLFLPASITFHTTSQDQIFSQNLNQWELLFKKQKSILSFECFQIIKLALSSLHGSCLERLRREAFGHCHPAVNSLWGWVLSSSFCFWSIHGCDSGPEAIRGEQGLGHPQLLPRWNNFRRKAGPPQQPL